MVWLPHRVRSLDVWELEPDIFITDLDPLGLDPRTARCVREGLEAYRRGAFLAAVSLIGAAVEGAWYAAGQRLRSTSPKLENVVDTDKTRFGATDRCGRHTAERATLVAGRLTGRRGCCEVSHRHVCQRW